MSEDLILKAIYEAKREQLLLGWKNPENHRSIDIGYAFAYDHRMCPTQTQDPDRVDPFEDTYEINRAFIEDVLLYLDGQWLKGNTDVPTFYELENKYGREKRYELMCVLRYAKVLKMFDDDFYKKIVSNAPAEANTIHQYTYGPDDVFLP
jgi:hypothetical protein